MEMIASKNLKDNRKYEITENQGEFLRDLNTYLPKLMNYLWENPKIVASMLENSARENEENIDLKDYIAPFITNNFYENILSSYFMEENLMYVITILLENEIKNMVKYGKTVKDFLSAKSPSGCILGELRRKIDIQTFFKTVIFKAIEELENNNSSSSFNFDISQIAQKSRTTNPKDTKNNKKKEDSYLKFTEGQNSFSNSLDDPSAVRNRKKFKQEQETFNQKYIPHLDKASLEENMNKYQDNKNMYDYCSSKLERLKKEDGLLFSNQQFMNNFYKYDGSENLILIYQGNFLSTIHIISLIIDPLITNAHLIPYSVKCICKIISMLIEKYFKNIIKADRNSFIAKFIFDRLLFPILEDPATEALISNFIITHQSKTNLKTICDVLEKFTSSDFYTTSENNGNYTPFNWFFLENMEKLFKIFDNITDVILPPFIEKLIKGEQPENFEYNYFKENPDEVINHQAICFNLYQVKAIINVFEKKMDKIFAVKKCVGLQKTIEKLLTKNNKETLETLLQNDKNFSKESQNTNTKKKKEPVTPPPSGKLHFFLFTNLIKNEKYQKLFKIEQKTASYSIPELKNTPDDESITKNNIIKVKNFICSLLYNYNKLVKTDFDKGTTENTQSILKELNIFMKSSNFVVDSSIPSEWYVLSLLEYLQKIPSELTDNDCENLYNEIEKDIKNSIKELDFEALGIVIGKMKYTKRVVNYYKESEKLLNDINLNEICKKIIETEPIPVEMKFFYEEEKKGFFEIYASNFKLKEKDKTNIKDPVFLEKIKSYEKSKKARLCLTIEDFTKKFPNLVKYQELQDADIFEMQKNLHFPEMIGKYFDIIAKHLKINSEKNMVICEKIQDHVMGKLYDKLYPFESYDEDNKIFQQSIKLSWTEDKHFIKSKRKLVFGSFINDIKTLFKLIDSEKAPRKKIKHMSEIFNSITFLLKFNGLGPDIGVDDQLPVLNYASIKAQPLRMYSNAKFMELYIGEKKSKNEGSQLTQFLGICEYISKIKPSQLHDVTNDEYIKRCNEATNNAELPI